MVGGKPAPPAGWQPSVADLHAAVKDKLDVDVASDIAAEGGATCKGLSRVVEEVWERRPVETGPFRTLRIAVVSWCCNDIATWNKNKDGRYKTKLVTPEMRKDAANLKLLLSRYDAGIITGPASAET